ncbi:MAG: hypothetical protein HQL52_04730 [Magnetococcales bacterium]|nr:hypothetical protein [Magnetococcales bacterium]
MENKKYTPEAIEEFVLEMPDSQWRQFVDLVLAEDERKSSQIRESAKEALKATAEQYGFSLEELLPGGGSQNSASFQDDKIPASALKTLQNLSPKGLYNPEAPPEYQHYHIPKGKTRWVKVRPWLKERLLQIKATHGRFPTNALSALVEEYPVDESSAVDGVFNR